MGKVRLLKNIWLHVWGTTVHKFWVWVEIQKVVLRLERRALVHDLSKYGIEESRGFVQVIHLLRTSTYGSPEYIRNKEALGPSLAAHFARNSHHPEHTGGRSDLMNFYDLVEMVCDWKAAVRRHADGNIQESFRINVPRFKISGELERLLREV